MIANKKELTPGVWMVELSSGDTLKVICREGQTPEEVLAEAEPD